MVLDPGDLHMSSEGHMVHVKLVIHQVGVKLDFESTLKTHMDCKPTNLRVLHMRLTAYEVYRASSLDPSKCHIPDLAHNCAYSGGTERRVGCLTKNTMPWLLNEDPAL